MVDKFTREAEGDKVDKGRLAGAGIAKEDEVGVGVKLFECGAWFSFSEVGHLISGLSF